MCKCYSCLKKGIIDPSIADVYIASVPNNVHMHGAINCTPALQVSRIQKLIMIVVLLVSSQEEAM